jgi:hypothetical protein
MENFYKSLQAIISYKLFSYKLLFLSLHGCSRESWHGNGVLSEEEEETKLFYFLRR